MWGYFSVRKRFRNGGLGISILIAPVLCTGALRAQNCLPAPSGLVSWWRGHGDGSDAAGTNNSTLMSGITFPDGKVGQAFSFNGVDSQVRFGNTVGNFGTNDFTIDFWIKTTGTRHESVIEKWPVCGVSSMWYLRIGGAGTVGRLGAEMFSDTLGNDHN